MGPIATGNSIRSQSRRRSKSWSGYPTFSGKTCARRLLPLRACAAAEAGQHRDEYEPSEQPGLARLRDDRGADDPIAGNAECAAAKPETFLTEVRADEVAVGADRSVGIARDRRRSIVKELDSDPKGAVHD